MLSWSVSARKHTFSHSSFINKDYALQTWANCLLSQGEPYATKEDNPEIHLAQLSPFFSTEKETAVNSFTTSQHLTILKKNPFENIIRKGENVGNQHFLLFPQFFPPFSDEISIFQ